MIAFIKLSRTRYFPIIKINKQLIIIIPDQIVIFDEIPNNSIAKPAVTIVTAAWIVKIVTTDNSRYINKT